MQMSLDEKSQAKHLSPASFFAILINFRIIGFKTAEAQLETMSWIPFLHSCINEDCWFFFFLILSILIIFELKKKQIYIA